MSELLESSHADSLCLVVVDRCQIVEDASAEHCGSDGEGFRLVICVVFDGSLLQEWEIFRGEETRIPEHVLVESLHEARVLVGPRVDVGDLDFAVLVHEDIIGLHVAKFVAVALDVLASSCQGVEDVPEFGLLEELLVGLTLLDKLGE